MASGHDGFLNEISAARSAFAAGKHEAAFARLERAHILGQLNFVDHVIAHLWMLRIALIRRDAGEIFGQVLRLAATVPGHLLGWLPIGNTGGANVSPLRPMPIPLDLKPYFEGFSLRRQIVRQAIVLSPFIALAIWLAA